jgi:hypothetical protein
MMRLMKNNPGETTDKFEHALEMIDCKHFRYEEILKNQGTGNVKILRVSNCLIGMGGIGGCQKYCPLYEPK